MENDGRSTFLEGVWDDMKQEVILLSQIEYLNKVDIFKVNFTFTSLILPHMKM